MLHVNIRRLAKNKGHLFALTTVIDYNFDVIVLSEVGNDADHYPNNRVFPNNDAYTDLPLSNRYGGTAILIRKGTGSVKIRDDMKLAKTCNCGKCEYENKWIEIDVDGTNFLIRSIYRHPNGNVEHFVNDLENVLPKVPRHQTCFILGDINIDLLKFNQTMTSNYFTSLVANNFRPYISTPTRLTDTTATIIDHIFVKTAQEHMRTKMESGNLYSDITDHLPNFIMWKKQREHTGNDRPLIRIYSDKNLKSFQNMLEGSNWDSTLTGENGDEMCENFYNHVLKKFAECFPLSYKSRKRSKDKKGLQVAWGTTFRRSTFCIKNNWNPLLKKKPEWITKYIKNILSTCLKDAENSYYINLVNEKQSWTTNFWKAYGATLNPNKRKQQNKLQKLIVDGKTLTDDKDIADGINNYFCTIGSKISSKIKSPGGHFTDYLKNKINNTFLYLQW